MNTEEAKLILSAVHDAAPDDTDAELGQAFSMLDSDPDLRHWFEQERAFDSAISSKLASVAPPPELKGSLLKILETGSAEPSAQRAHKLWFRPPFLAAAAAVILIPLLAIQLLTSRAGAKSFDTFRSDMVKLAVGEFELDHRESDLQKLYAWLNANNATCPTDIPECVGCPESIGCKVIAWNDDSVTLICLRNATNQVVHCFVIPRDQFGELPDEQRLRTELTVADLKTCGWTDQSNVYLLVGSAKDVRVNAPRH